MQHKKYPHWWNKSKETLKFNTQKLAVKVLHYIFLLALTARKWGDLLLLPCHVGHWLWHKHKGYCPHYSCPVWCPCQGGLLPHGGKAKGEENQMYSVKKIHLEHDKNMRQNLDSVLCLLPEHDLTHGSQRKMPNRAFLNSVWFKQVTTADVALWRL